MKTAKMIDEVLQIVTEETDVTKEQIYSHNREAEIVDARYIFISSLHGIGLYVTTISRELGISQRAVQYAIARFSERVSVNVPLKRINKRVKSRIMSEIVNSEL